MTFTSVKIQGTRMLTRHTHSSTVFQTTIPQRLPGHIQTTSTGQLLPDQTKRKRTRPRNISRTTTTKLAYLTPSQPLRKNDAIAKRQQSTQL
jgi:hypothetical protein